MRATRSLWASVKLSKYARETLLGVLRQLNTQPLHMSIAYMRHGGGQVPLQLPPSPGSIASSISQELLPTYPPIAVHSSAAASDSPVFAPDASHHELPSTIDITIPPHSLQQSPEEAPTPSLVSVDAPVTESDAQMKGRKPAIAAGATFMGLFTYSQIYQHALFPKITPRSERADERQWVASSPSWIDRTVCDWFGFCGLAHLNQAGWTGWEYYKKHRPSSSHNSSNGQVKVDLEDFLRSAKNLSNPGDWSEDERTLREIPKYVLDHAPYIHLFSGEEFWPGDMAEHLIHTTPHLNYTPLQASSDHPNLTNLNELNSWGRFVYLQSDDNVEDRPKWLGGETNIPSVPDDSDPENWKDWVDRADGSYREDADGEEEDWFSVGDGDTEVDEQDSTGRPARPKRPARRNLGKKLVGGRSDAPAVLIVTEKPDGVVDAFYFFFYSYNLGNKVFNIRFGNHVGDWEHTAVRFQHGEPKAVYFSEHNFGEAYTWDAVEKIGNRPVGYSAVGSHAMYAEPGVHPYGLPGGILHDETDRGPLWDPLLNVHSFTYDYRQDKLRSSNLTPQAPIEWFYFIGHWGDKFYPLSDPRQYRFLGQYHYVNGPLGPRFKNLGREQICPGIEDCMLKSWVGPSRQSRRIKQFPEVGEGEEMSEADIRRFVGSEHEDAA